jgi:hypothetical protein
MNSVTESGSKLSFYRRHLHLTGVERADGLSAAELAADRADMAAIDLPPLTFLPSGTSGAVTPDVPDQKGVARVFDWLVRDHGSWLGVAAMMFLVMIPALTMRPAERHPVLPDTVRAKGGEKIVLYVERNGVVTLHAAGAALQNGDRLRTEIIAGSERVAYQFVTNADRQVLSTVADLLNERIYIRSGEKGIFPGSIELVGRSEGETLNVLLCEGQVPTAAVIEFIKEYQADGEGVAPKGCLLKSIGLR